MRKALIYWLPLAVYSAVILFLSLDPEPPPAPEIEGLDKLVHFIAYTIMGALFARALLSGIKEAGKRRVIFLVFIVTFIFGLFIEVWQSFIPSRSADSIDAIANGAGGLFGAFAFSRFIKVKGGAR